MLGKIEGKRRRGKERMRCLGGITGPMDVSLSKLWKSLETLPDKPRQHIKKQRHHFANKVRGNPGDADSGPQVLLGDGRCCLTSLDLISFSVTIVPA